MDEFEEWAQSWDVMPGTIAWSMGKQAWLESARRADKRAREECAEICRWAAEKYGAEARIGAEACESAIRNTIPEE